ASLEGLMAKFDFILEVRGRGLLVALELSTNIADDVVRACLEEGLLLNAVKTSALRFMPPLIIGESEVDEAMDILEKVLAGVSEEAVATRKKE
ncbi:MAG: aminotransferase class III-fold pyridoxal phosphate-dependent enzyme, partial [Dehalococcoidia bacterium]